MSIQLSSVIIEYAKSLPPWQKILAKAAFEHEGDLSQAKEIDAAISRFLKDATPSLSDKVAGDEEIKFIDSLQAAAEQGSTVIPRLIEISDYQNVNALSDGQRITFAPKLTIIYGENGAGKSGYNRVLNSAFYSRGDKTILPNILKPQGEQGKPSAKFEFEVAGKSNSKLFPTDLGSPEFKQFACFDSKTVPAHLEDSNELYVIPKEMNFFDRLAQLIGHASKKLQTEITKRSKTNEFGNYFDGESTFKAEIKAINANTDFQKISAVGAIKEDLEKELLETEKEYHELKLTDPKKMVGELKLAISECEAYSKDLLSYLEKCNEDSVQKIQSTIDTLNRAEESVTKSGAESFKTELLKTVGSEKWRQFIVSTSALIKDEKGALGREFPVNGDSCPLCLQKLEANALSLFGRYFDFLGGQAEKDLKTAKDAIKALTLSYDTSKLTNIASKQNFAKWLESSKPEDKTALVSLDESIKTFFTKAKERLASPELPAAASVNSAFVKETFEDLKTIIEESIKTFDEATFTKKLKDLSDKITLLKHKLKFLELAQEIEKYIKIQNWCNGASAAIKTINTRGVTEKQKKVFDEYFTKQYRQVFLEEAQKLKVNFKVDVKPKGSAGKSLRKLDVFNYSPAEVLSEGEQRAIALADFLTEIEICNLKGGIIFDDPVNSLDHERKLYIAGRLVEESKKRQVVVFTHDVSFLFDLINESERQKFKENEDFYCHWISKIEDNTGLVNLGHRKDLELDYKTHTRADEYWQKARKETIPDNRELLSKQGFDCLRRTYEAFTINELFGNTVRRFDRQIGHGTLKSVFCPRDVAEFVSNKLEICSGFVTGHLQADGYSGPTASPELLKQEIDAYIEFKRKYKERKEADKNSVATPMIPQA